jgi:hypothetical protein
MVGKARDTRNEGGKFSLAPEAAVERVFLYRERAEGGFQRLGRIFNLMQGGSKRDASSSKS